MQTKGEGGLKIPKILRMSFIYGPLQDKQYLSCVPADACLIFHENTLYLIAGATAKYLYAHDPSKVRSCIESCSKYRVTHLAG